MIGILLALQVNTWNEHRKDRIRETKILDQIHIDFLRNKVQIDSIRSSNEKALISCEKIISFLPLSKTKASLDSVTKYIQDATQIRTFNPSNGSIDALINSSSFEVIQNDTLRNLLVSWKDVYLDYREEEQNARNYQINVVNNFFGKHLNRLDRYSDSNLELITTNEFSNIWFDKAYNYRTNLSAIKDEQLEHYILEILRLTERKN